MTVTLIQNFLLATSLMRNMALRFTTDNMSPVFQMKLKKVRDIEVLLSQSFTRDLGKIKASKSSHLKIVNGNLVEDDQSRIRELIRHN